MGYRENKAEKQRAKRREFAKIKQDIKSERGCKICGERKWYMLVFHHRNENEKVFEISEIQHTTSKKSILIKDSTTNRRHKYAPLANILNGGGICNKEILIEEIAKCDVYCMNHHAELHWIDNQNKGE